ncbi:IS1 family transposase, partial [Escherichia coli]|uniref:IS1 family transposase n=1 Tax=Escherichia coli TaxID=562 RepID=UPI003095DAE1
QPGSDVIVCAEMDEQWGYVGAKSRQRWLFYAYDSLRKTVVAHVFGERTMATLGRLMSLLSPFDVVIWMTDGWPLYESRLKGKLHVISKRYTQRIERHNLRGSMSAKGCCYDNACVESFFHSLKVECIHGEHFISREIMRATVFNYIECDYNRWRRHSWCGGLSPEQFENKNLA